jgi:hypothetical protein
MNNCIVLNGTYTGSIFFQNTALDRESNPHLIFYPSEAVKRVRIRFVNIR